MNFKNIASLASVCLFLILFGCKSNSNDDLRSRTTGMARDPRKGGTEAKKNYYTRTPSGMVFIEGGTFTMGEKGEYITAQRNNSPRRITVSSFYMDQYEIRNIDWREYTNWMKVVFGKTAPKLVEKTLPDLKVWREELAYNEPYLENYFTSPAFDQYPIVGVSWDQAMDYCSWRTDRVNELALIESGVIAAPDFAKLEKQTNADSVARTFVFNTQKYLIQSEFQPANGKNPKKDTYGKNRKVDMTDGILYSSYRLPTEAEWEFAAYAIKADLNGNVVEGKIYPWSGAQARSLSKKDQGRMQANFVRGRGDMMGTSGRLNDRATITAPVNWYQPNDFGLYNMAGNVNEWVLDVYRATTYADVAEYNSFRGNIYTSPFVEKVDSIGNKKYTIDELGRVKLINSKSDDVRNYKDGDPMSQIEFDIADTTGLANLKKKSTDPTDILRPTVTDKTRVYKGGSWKDRIFWLNPSTRRFLEQDKSANDIGFRCAMSMTGDIQLKKKK
jgi:formylglycine-generating enzyme